MPYAHMMLQLKLLYVLARVVTAILGQEQTQSVSVSYADWSFTILRITISSFHIEATTTLAPGTQKAYLKPAHIGSQNPGFQTGQCPTSSDGPYGWHFVLQGTSTSFVSIHCLFQSAGVVTSMIQTPTNKHAYVFTPTADTLLDAWAVVQGPDTEFVLSHVCNPGA